MIKSYLSRTVNKYLNKYFELINSNDLEYGLLSGELILKNLSLKRNALAGFGGFEVTSSKIEEIFVKYNWSLLNKDSIHIKVKNIYINVEVCDVLNCVDRDKEKFDGLRDTDIHIECENIHITMMNVSFNIPKIEFKSLEIVYKKMINFIGCKINLMGSQVVEIPFIQCEYNLKDLLCLCINVNITKIFTFFNYKTLKELLNIYKIVKCHRKPSKVLNSVKLSFSIYCISNIFTDIRKKVIIKNTLLTISNKLKIVMEQLIGLYLKRKYFIHNTTSSKKPEFTFSGVFLDTSLLKIENLQLEMEKICSFEIYKKLLNDFRYDSTSEDNNFVICVKKLQLKCHTTRILIQNMRAEISNQFYEEENFYKFSLIAADLQIDECCKVDCIKLKYNNKFISCETGKIGLYLDKMNILSFYKIYKKYFKEESTIKIGFRQRISNLTISYGINKKLCDINDIEINFNTIKKSRLSRVFTVKIQNDLICEMMKYKDKNLIGFSNFHLDLNIIKDFYVDFLSSNLCLIKQITDELKNGGESNYCLTFYGISLKYENLKLVIDYLEVSKQFKFIFSIYLAEEKYVIVDKAHLKVDLYKDLLQIYSNNHIRINLTHCIMKNLLLYWDDLMAFELPFMKSEETELYSWNINLESISLNIFDDKLMEILAIHIYKFNVGNINEESEDKFIKRLYFKIEDVQIDNQNYKNNYPVVLSKISGDSFISGSVLYYFNNSTICLVKSNINFGDLACNIEETFFHSVIEIFNNLPVTEQEKNTQQFSDTCITVKDFKIEEISVKINWLKNEGSDLKEKLLVLLTNNISDFTFVADRLLLLCSRTTFKGLTSTLYDYYKNQFYINLVKVVGHLDLLGNVGSFTNTIKSTIKNNGKKQTGFFKGSGNIIKNTFFGVTKTIGKISNSVKNNAGLFTFDKEFNESSKYHSFLPDENLPIPHKKNNVKSIELLMKGTGKMMSSVYSGIVGVAKKPIDGYQNGISGVFVGLGKGMVGAISKPIVGASELVSNCTKIISGPSDIKHRVMYPLYTKDSIDHYNLDLSTSYYIYEVFLRHLTNETFLDGSFGYYEGELVVILTSLRLIISSERFVIDINPKDVEFDSRDTNGFRIESNYITVNRKMFLSSLRKAIEETY